MIRTESAEPHLETIANQRPVRDATVLAPLRNRRTRHVSWREVLFVGLANLLPPLAFVRLRTRLLGLAGLLSGDRTAFGGRVRITGRGLRPASRITVGDNCWINDSCTFDASATITIGNGTAFGHEVALITSTHEIGPYFYRAGPSADLPIVIGDGAWIGARAIVLPGVTVGTGSIVAAGSVVNRDIEPNVLAAGVPAQVIRRLDGHCRVGGDRF